MVEARADESWLYLSGKLKPDPDNFFDDYVEVWFWSNVSVRYDQQNVPIAGDVDGVTNLDARALRGGGVQVYWNTSDEDHIALLSKEGDGFFGGNGRDVVKGRGGDDYLYGNQGNDKLVGQSGDDSLYGGYDSDVLKGGSGDDLLSGLFGNDKLKAGSGNDTVFGGDDDDRLWGHGGDDLLNGGNGFDIAYFDGNAADYEITVVDGNYRIVDLREGSPDGTDHFAHIEKLRFADDGMQMDPLFSELTASASADTLFISGPAARTDTVDQVVANLRYGVDDMAAVFDNNLIPLEVPVADNTTGLYILDATGLTGAGVYSFDASIGYLSNQSDSFYGDRAYGYGGDDFLFGNGGPDWLYGGTGEDLIIADSYALPYYSENYHDDTLLGGQGNDTIDGYIGHDTIIGGDGDDELWGGPGDDYIHGGDGHDVAVFWGDEADFVITEENGVTTVAPVDPDSYVGTDTLIMVEELRFVPFGTPATAGDSVDSLEFDGHPADAFATGAASGPPASSMLPQPIETPMPADIAPAELMIH